MWFLFAMLSAIFAALTSILAKIGIDGVNLNLATAIRTIVVVIIPNAVPLRSAPCGKPSLPIAAWQYKIYVQSWYLP